MKNMLKIRIHKEGKTAIIYLGEEKASPEGLLSIMKDRKIDILSFATWEDGDKKLEGYVMVSNQKRLKKIILKISKAKIK